MCEFGKTRFFAQRSCEIPCVTIEPKSWILKSFSTRWKIEQGKIWPKSCKIIVRLTTISFYCILSSIFVISKISYYVGAVVIK